MMRLTHPVIFISKGYIALEFLTAKLKQVSFTGSNN